MATDINLLMGEIVENPNLQEQDVEPLLLSFLKALVEDQKKLQDLNLAPLQAPVIL